MNEQVASEPKVSNQNKEITQYSNESPHALFSGSGSSGKTILVERIDTRIVNTKNEPTR